MIPSTQLININVINYLLFDVFDYFQLSVKSISFCGDLVSINYGILHLNTVSKNRSDKFPRRKQFRVHFSLRFSCDFFIFDLNRKRINDYFSYNTTKRNIISNNFLHYKNYAAIIFRLLKHSSAAPEIYEDTDKNIYNIGIDKLFKYNAKKNHINCGFTTDCYSISRISIQSSKMFEYYLNFNNSNKLNHEFLSLRDLINNYFLNHNGSGGEAHNFVNNYFLISCKNINKDKNHTELNLSKNDFNIHADTEIRNNIWFMYFKCDCSDG